MKNNTQQLLDFAKSIENVDVDVVGDEGVELTYNETSLVTLTIFFGHAVCLGTQRTRNWMQTSVDLDVNYNAGLVHDTAVLEQISEELADVASFINKVKSAWEESGISE